MPQASPTNALFARAADKVMRTFAERTAGGELDGEAVVIEWRDNRNPWKGSGIVGAMTTEREAESLTSSRENRTLLDRVPLTLVGRISEPHGATVYIPSLGERGWKVADVSDDGVMMRLTLERVSVAAKQKAGLERGV